MDGHVTCDIIRLEERGNIPFVFSVLILFAPADLYINAKQKLTTV